MNVREWIGRVLDLIYPPALYCICCGNLIDETRTYHLCDHCLEHIRWDLGAPLERDGVKMLRCAQYGIYERTLIFSLKYNQKKYIARDIGEICYDRLQQANVSFDVVVPVPIAPSRQKVRGFNHAGLIGKYLSQKAGVPCLENALVRSRDTRPMRGLSPKERQENVAGSVMLQKDTLDLVKGKRVLLLDDFFTTGSTALECVRALREGDPADVVFLAFAAK